jgi:hypothetical protein
MTQSVHEYRVAQARQVIRCYEEATGRLPDGAVTVISWAEEHPDSLPFSDGELVPLYDAPQVADDALTEAVVEILRERTRSERQHSHHWMKLGEHAFGLVEDGRMVAAVYWMPAETGDQDAAEGEPLVAAAGWYLVDARTPDAHESLVVGGEQIWYDALARAEHFWLSDPRP